MQLRDLYLSQGAALAPDAIPLHFGDTKAEYVAALEQAVLLDRSHEARLTATGRDRFELLNRISTNDLLSMQPGEGRPTLFTNANARILDRAVVYQRGEQALLLGEPGRSAALLSYLQRQIFFNDQVNLDDLSNTTYYFALHGPSADVTMDSAVSGIATLPPMHGQEATIAGIPVFAARNKPLSGSHWSIVVPKEGASDVWSALTGAGKAIPAGSLIYNVLRIRAGRPGVGRELSREYIPLEVGLWDEVSFHKGCYTGQEIIARMESRKRLAKTMVQLQLDSPSDAPVELYHEERRVGTLTSVAVAPSDEIFALGILKTQFAHVGLALKVASPSGPLAQVRALAGTQPDYILPEDSAEA
jgi:folate-binding protein YgfZ